MDTRLLGLPLHEAEDILKREGVTPRVIVTRAPRDEREGGNLRVIRHQGDTLTVAAFHEQLTSPS